MRRSVILPIYTLRALELDKTIVKHYRGTRKEPIKDVMKPNFKLEKCLKTDMVLNQAKSKLFYGIKNLRARITVMQ